MKPTKIMEESINRLNQNYTKISENSNFDEKKTFDEFIKPLFSYFGWDLSKNSLEVIPIEVTSKNKAD